MFIDDPILGAYHITIQSSDPKGCPRAQSCDQHTNAVFLEPEYGFTRYGLGSFDRCPECGKVFNFDPEPEE